MNTVRNEQAVEFPKHCLVQSFNELVRYSHRREMCDASMRMDHFVLLDDGLRTKSEWGEESIGSDGDRRSRGGTEDGARTQPLDHASRTLE